MKLRLSFLFVAAVSLASCGAGAPNSQQRQEAMKVSAQVAERNLVKLRDGVVAYYKKHQQAPVSIDDLESVGSGTATLEASEDYADLGYNFYKLDFSPDGTLKQGWFLASPRGDRKAMRVRMDGVSGAFDYTPPGEEMGAAPGDNGG